MTARARLIPIVAVSLVVPGGTGFTADSVRAEENCLAAPNRQAPQGSHWYYHLDRLKQNKCWYLRTEGPTIQKPAAREESETSDVPNSPAVTSKITPDQQAQTGRQRLGPIESAPILGGQLTREGGQNPVRPAKVDAPAWQDSPSSTEAVMIWPDPPAPNRPNTQSAIGVGDPEETLQLAPDVPVPRDEGALRPDRTIARADEQGGMVASHPVMPMSIALAGAVGLAIAGIVLRLILRVSFARRRIVYTDRREPDWIDRIACERVTPRFAAPPRDPAPGRVDEDRLGDGVQRTLRILARVLDQQAA